MSVLRATWFDTPAASSFLLMLASLIAIPLLLRMRDRRGMTMTQNNAEWPGGPAEPPLSGNDDSAS